MNSTQSKKSEIEKSKDIKERYGHMYSNLLWSLLFALVAVILTVFGASITIGLIGTGIIIIDIVLYVFLINQELNEINTLVKQD